MGDDEPVGPYFFPVDGGKLANERLAKLEYDIPKRCGKCGSVMKYLHQVEEFCGRVTVSYNAECHKCSWTLDVTETFRK